MNEKIENIIFALVITLSIGISALAGYRFIKNIVSNNQNTSQTNNNKLSENTNCIVKINGNQYDVSKLKRTHSGGDIFSCSTDMTDTFKNQHGTNWSLISQYIIATNTESGLPASDTKVTDKSNTGITALELSKHNKASSCYVAYNAKVYDVTNKPEWRGCLHHGVRGGIDITNIFPHSLSYLNSLKLVGVMNVASTKNSGSPTGTTPYIYDDKEDDELENED